MSDTHTETEATAKPKRPRLSLEQKLARLKQQEQQLLTQKKEATRKLDDRRKIIIGGTVIKAMEADADLTARIVALLEASARPQDREAIGPWLATISASK